MKVRRERRTREVRRERDAERKTQTRVRRNKGAHVRRESNLYINYFFFLYFLNFFR